MSCCTISFHNLGLAPKYKGVDSEAVPYVTEFKKLAKDHNVTFSNNVTIGFDDIKSEYVVGYCEYGISFREVTLDSKYWEDYTPIKKMVLVWHELGHCYCDKTHGYGKGKLYGGDDSKNRQDDKQKDGFYPDTCPISLMYPYVIDDYCFSAHYAEYVDELFKDCEPY